MGEVLFTVATLKAKPINTGKREGRSPNSLNSENWNIFLFFFVVFFRQGTQTLAHIPLLIPEGEDYERNASDIFGLKCDKSHSRE